MDTDRRDVRIVQYNTAHPFFCLHISIIPNSPKNSQKEGQELTLTLLSHNPILHKRFLWLLYESKRQNQSQTHKAKSDLKYCTFK